MWCSLCGVVIGPKTAVVITDQAGGLSKIVTDLITDDVTLEVTLETYACS